MKKYAFLLSAMIFAAAALWAQSPQEPPLPPADFAWLDDPTDEALMDLAAEIPEPEPPLPPFRSGMGMTPAGRLDGKLKLTEAQQKTLQDMRIKHQKEMIPFQGEWKSKHLDLQSALQADKPDMARINALVDQIAKIKADMQKKQIAFRLDVRNQLTPEQLKIWRENRGRPRWDGMPDRRSMAGPRPGGRPGRGTRL